MFEYEKELDDRCIDRAVELWVRALRKPKFDNGAYDTPNLIANSLAANFAAKELSKELEEANAFEAKLEVFRRDLSEKIKKRRDSDQHLYRRLGVDYHPDTYLRESAEVAGISVGLFSIKSDVSFYNHFVQASFGYGAEDVNHYPLDGGLEAGNWLITTLRGSDIEIIKNAVTINTKWLAKLNIEITDTGFKQEFGA